MSTNNSTTNVCDETNILSRANIAEAKRAPGKRKSPTDTACRRIKPSDTAQEANHLVIGEQRICAHRAALSMFLGAIGAHEVPDSAWMGIFTKCLKRGKTYSIELSREQVRELYAALFMRNLVSESPLDKCPMVPVQQTAISPTGRELKRRKRSASVRRSAT